MAHITEEHLHHMARRHHATMQKLNGLTERISRVAQKSFGAIETGLGSFAGGLIEGGTHKMPGLGPLPVNLILGAGLLVAGYTNFAERRGLSSHFNNLGNGFVGSYLASAGYAFGKRWADTGRVFGGGAGSPFFDPYGNGWSKPAAAAPPPPPAPPAPAMGW